MGLALRPSSKPARGNRRVADVPLWEEIIACTCRSKSVAVVKTRVRAIAECRPASATILRAASLRSVWLALLLAMISSLGLAGCVTGQADTNKTSISADTSCDKLTGARRKAARLLDALESGRAVPNTTGVLLAVSVFAPLSVTAGLGNASRDRERTIASLETEELTLDQQINDQQCTVEARARAGLIKTTADDRFDGNYVGKGTTESWCVPPLLSLTVKSGQLRGELKVGSTPVAVYEVKGQLYNDGQATLHFKRPESKIFTDDFDARLTKQTLSFRAELDMSRKACIYHFDIGKGRTEAAAPPVSHPFLTGEWKANSELIVGESAGSCAQTGGVYVLDVANDVFTAKNANGTMFSTSIPADGIVRQSFRSSTGANLEMKGNARSRDLEVSNNSRGCRWKLVPERSGASNP